MTAILPYLVLSFVACIGARIIALNKFAQPEASLQDFRLTTGLNGIGTTSTLIGWREVSRFLLRNFRTKIVVVWLVNLFYYYHVVKNHRKLITLLRSAPSSN